MTFLGSGATDESEEEAVRWGERSRSLSLASDEDEDSLDLLEREGRSRSLSLSRGDLGLASGSWSLRRRRGSGSLEGIVPLRMPWPQHVEKIWAGGRRALAAAV